jgi:hypothetical protein
MGRFISILAASIFGLIILGGAWLYSQPNQWRVQHQAHIDAPIIEVFTQLNSLKKLPEWSSWKTEFLPTLKSRYSGPDSGVGASEHWELDGNSGSTTIVTSKAYNYIEYRVVSSDGYFVATGYYELTESSNGTQVNWVYQGDSGNNLLLKLYMLGALPEIDKGNQWSLANLKQRLESAAP